MKNNPSAEAAVPSIPKPVEDAYRENRLALFVGSGLSLGKDVRGNFPTWGEVGLRLLDYAAEKGLQPEKKIRLRRACVEEAESLDELLDALEAVKTVLGPHYGKALLSVFLPEDAKPGAAHEAVRDLDVPALLTTNYDRLLEVSEPKDRLMFTWLGAIEALQDLRLGHRVLFKVHGTVEQEESIVLTRLEYKELERDKSYREVLRFLLMDHMFLFVGYGMNDPYDLDRVLAANQQIFKQANRDHFALLWDGDGSKGDAGRYKRDYRVSPIHYAEHDQIVPFLKALARTRPAGAASIRPAACVTQDAMACWRKYQRNVHANLVPFFKGAGNELIDKVYVELGIEEERNRKMDIESAVCGEARAGAARSGEGRPQVFSSLDRLLTVAAEGEIGRHWMVLGDPGAGKTTLARHLVWSRSSSTDEDVNRPVPVYASLPRLARERKHPFELAELDLASQMGEAAGQGLAGRLWELSEEPGRVWLLLDGLDEVDADGVERIVETLQVLSSDLPHAVITVLSRPVGSKELGPGYRKARVRPLGDDAQQELLRNWLGEDKGISTYHLLEEQPVLLEHARNPLMLTLVAMLCRENDQGLPPRRVDVYRDGVTLLLKRGHHVEPRGVKEPGSARALLSALSLRLQETTGEVWPQDVLEKHLWEVRESSRTLGFQLKETWGSNDAFLKDVSQNAGIVAPHDGPREPWRYLHRSFREYLTAEALYEEGLDKLVARAGKLDEEETGRWGETLALTAGLFDTPLELLERLRDIKPELALRALLHVEPTAPGALLDFLWSTPRGDDEYNPSWDGDYLLRLVRAWSLPPSVAATHLMAEVRSERSIVELAYLHHVLDRIGAPPDRERFFKACGRWPGGTFPEVPFVGIPGGTFWMGSLKDESGSLDSERPRHEVLVRGFEMAKTPTTRAQYARFDPSHESSHGESDECPVNEISWWEAYLYAKWLGARLPSEAEWEYACRAGTTTRFYSGADDADLDRVGWYDKNSGNGTHPVGQEDPNGFGLYDMHGNVWEWVEDDWHGNYDGAPVDGSAWVEETRAGYRVVRGGSWFAVAGYCRSACRNFWRPGGRDFLGFRVARSIP